MDLAEFLLARIGEDEEDARASVTDYCDTAWRVDPGLGVVDQYDSVLVYREGDEPFIEHIARWDPARVLAECEAKRGLVVMYQAVVQRKGEEPNRMTLLFAEQSCEDLIDVLRLVALPYASHPDYREEWRP